MLACTKLETLALCCRSVDNSVLGHLTTLQTLTLSTTDSEVHDSQGRMASTMSMLTSLTALRDLALYPLEALDVGRDYRAFPILHTVTSLRFGLHGLVHAPLLCLSDRVRATTAHLWDRSWCAPWLSWLCKFPNLQHLTVFLSMRSCHFWFFLSKRNRSRMPVKDQRKPIEILWRP